MKIKSNRLMLFSLIIILTFFIPFINALGVAVSPPTLNFDINIGETVTQNFFILNFDEEAVNYQISVKDYNDWLEFSNNSIEVPAKENKKIQVNVKPNEIGNFETIIYVNAVQKESTSGGASVGVTPGVGIKTKINVKKPEETNSPAQNNPVTFNNGGGGGGFITKKKINETMNSGTSIGVCVENWECSDWSECNIFGKQSRECIDKNNCGTKNLKPEETKDCTADKFSTMQTQPFYSKILGAVIGAGGKVWPWGAVAFAIIIAALFIIVAIVRKGKKLRG